MKKLILKTVIFYTLILILFSIQCSREIYWHEFTICVSPKDSKEKCLVKCVLESFDLYTVEDAKSLVQGRIDTGELVAPSMSFCTRYEINLVRENKKQFTQPCTIL